MGRTWWFTQIGSIALVALAPFSEVSAQATPAIKRQASFSVYGCAKPEDPADPTFCAPSRWYFRQGYIGGNPSYVEWAVWFPTYDCVYGTGSIGPTATYDCGGFFPIPQFGPRWQFSNSANFHVLTTDGRLLGAQNDGDFYHMFDWDVRSVGVRIWGYDTRIVPDRWTTFAYTATATPEPATVSLVAVGLGGVGAAFRFRRRRRR